jgi:tetratricopeptide (TPR) repeat protein
MRIATMKITESFRALLMSAAVVAVAALAPSHAAWAADQPKNSAKLAKPLKEAHDALNGKKYSEAISKLREAESTAGKTPYDQHLINDMLGFAYYKTGNAAEAAKAWESELDDGFLKPDEAAQKTKALAEINYQLKNYDKAIDFGNRATKGGFADEGIRTIVAQSYYLKGDYKNTLKFEEGMVDNQIKAGETPKNDQLMLLYSACQKLNDEACSTRAMEKLVTYYPKPENWAQLLYNMRRQAGSNEANLLETYRLMFDTDVLKESTDYSEMAELALDAGSPGEAQSVLEKAISKDVFKEQRTKERSQRLLEGAKKRAASDQSTLPRLEQEANAAANGDKNIAVGRAYLGYGRYDKAAEQLSKGLSKGVSKSEPESRLLLGIAQLKAGHKEDAVKTFHAVKGDPTLERLANLWSLHAKQA